MTAFNSRLGPVQCLSVGSHDKHLGAERHSDRAGGHGRTASDCGDQGEEGG